MRILIVEDDSFKLDAIVAVIDTQFNTIASAASSLRSAMTLLEECEFDFVVLDMAIPSHTSDVGAIDTYSQPVGGLDVLLFLASEQRPERVAILTQYPTVEYDRRHVPLKDLNQVLREDGVNNVAGVIHFGEKTGWREELLRAMGVGFEDPIG